MKSYDLTTPLAENEIKTLQAGDKVLLSGVIYTARDAAHKRMIDTLEAGGELPFDIRGQMIYYMGAYGSPQYTHQLADAETAGQLTDRLSRLIIDEKAAASFRKRFSPQCMTAEFESGNDRLFATYRILTDDGEVHWIASYFHITRNPYNNHIEAIVYSEDSEYEHNREVITAHITAKDYDYIGLLDTETRLCRLYVNQIMDIPTEANGVVEYGDAAAYICKNMIPDEEKEYYRLKTEFRHIIGQLANQPEYSISYFYIDAEKGRRRKQLIFRYLEDDRRIVMVTRTDITDAFMIEIIIEHLTGKEAIELRRKAKP
jgi:Tartrate dehydratase beta subunit/Fumarate hydratase class I, C-terminal domain